MLLANDVMDNAYGLTPATEHYNRSRDGKHDVNPRALKGQ